MKTGRGSIARDPWAQSAPEDVARQLPMLDEVQLGLAEPLPCPEYHRDYVKIAAWVFAFLFGPALVALAVLLA
jgi:hypothetical protein